MNSIIQKLKLPSKLPDFFSRFASGGRINKKKRQQRLRKEREAKEAAAAQAEAAAAQNVVSEPVADEGIFELFNVKVGANINLASLSGSIYEDKIDEITNCFETDEIFTDLKRTCVSSGELKEELLFVRSFYEKQVIYPLIDKVDMSMIGVNVGDSFIVLEKGARVDEVLVYLESAGMDQNNVLWYDYASKKPLNYESVTFTREELILDVQHLFLITKANIKDYRHCICFQRTFCCFIIPCVLPDWKDWIAFFLNEEADGTALDVYSLPKDVAAQWLKWESSSEFLCSNGEKDNGNIDVAVVVQILHRKSMPVVGSEHLDIPLRRASLGIRDDQTRRFYSSASSGSVLRAASSGSVPGAASAGSVLPRAASAGSVLPRAASAGSVLLHAAAAPGSVLPRAAPGSVLRSASAGPSADSWLSIAAKVGVSTVADGGISTAHDAAPGGLTVATVRPGGRWNMLLSSVSKVIKYFRK